MFKSLAVVATLAVAVVAQDKPLWKQPEIPTECQGDCIGMLKFQSKCAKADLTCLVELCTDPDTVIKCLTCAKADTEEFKNGCKQIQENIAKGSTEIPTGTAADAIADSIIASQSAASAAKNGGGGGEGASATPTESQGEAQASDSAAPAPAAEGDKKDGDASATPTASSGDAQASSGNAPASSGNAASSGGSAAGNAASSGSSAAAAATSKAADKAAAGKLAPAALVGAAGLLAALI